MNHLRTHVVSITCVGVGFYEAFQELLVYDILSYSYFLMSSQCLCCEV